MPWDPKFDLDFLDEDNQFLVSREGVWKDEHLIQFIPVGFKTNLANVSLHPKSHAAAVVHDYMYFMLPKKRFSIVRNFTIRYRADKTFYRILRHDGVPILPSVIMFLGVVLFGGIHRALTKNNNASMADNQLAD